MSAAILGLLLATPALAAETPEVLALQAERIAVEDGIAIGEGSVRGALLGGELRAERFALREDGGGAVIERGCWRGPQGYLCFERLELDADGRLRLDGARVSLCGCEGARQPWELQAWRVRVDPERSAVFAGGLLRVAGCPVLPLPAGALPLGRRRSGLLAPVLGWTADGLEVGEPLFLAFTPALDLTVTPTWRQERGARLDGELRWALPGGGGWLDAAGGWDEAEGGWRGLVEGRHGHADRALRDAWEGSLASDPDYLDDFGAEFAARQVGFHEERGLVGIGPLRLEHDVFQAEDEALQRLAGLVLQRAARDGWPLSPGARLDLELGGWGRGPGALDRTWLALRGDAELRGGRRLGVLEAGLQASGSGLLLQELEPGAARADALRGSGQAAAETRLELPLWADRGVLRHLFRPGLAAGTAWASPEDTQAEPGPRIEALPAWWVGPSLGSRWLSAAGVPLELRAELPWSAEGLAPSAEARWRRGAWWGRAQSSLRWRPGSDPEAGLLFVEAGRSGEALSASAGVLGLQGAAEQGQLAARLAWRLHWGKDAWEPRGRLRLSLADGHPVEGQAGLRFASRCGCLGIEVLGTWAEDRALPELGLRFDLGS